MFLGTGKMMLERGQQVIDLKGVDGPTLKKVISGTDAPSAPLPHYLRGLAAHFTPRLSIRGYTIYAATGVYTRELELDDETLERLLRASLYLGVSEVQQAICEYLTSRLSVETCLVRPFPTRMFSTSRAPTPTTLRLKACGWSRAYAKGGEDYRAEGKLWGL